MADDLTTVDGRSAFERRITDLLSTGEIETAINAISPHVVGRPALEGILRETPRIDAWDEIAADSLQADESFTKDGYGPATSLVITLWRNEDTGTVGLDRTFHVGGSADGDGSLRDWNPGDWRRHVPVVMKGVAVLWHSRHALKPEELLLFDCIALVQALRAIDGALLSRGLPHPLAVVVASVAAGRQEPGDPTTLPEMTRRAPVPAAMNPLTAAAAIDRRKAENGARFQDMVGTMLAEHRELYRLVRLFPFYRMGSRRRLGEMLDKQLGVMCRSQNLSTRGVGWRMRPRTFEALLRNYAEKRGVHDVDATLNTDRVDTLHNEWLRTARSCAFDLPKQPFSLFAINLTWGLTFGGPLVQDRWARLKRYDPDMPTAIDRWSPESATH